MTSPMGFLERSGHSTIRTKAFCPFFLLEFVLGDEDVVGQPFAVGNEKTVGSFHLQHPYKGGRGMFRIATNSPSGSL